MKKARILLALLLGLLAGYWARPAGLAAQNPNRAALVVRSGDQQVQTACVEFSEPEISGLDLLLRSGLDVEIEAQGLGALVCSIDGTGCGAEDCWCQCKGGGDCIYWSYWLRPNGGWQYAQIGSIMTKVTSGSIQGWSWGPGAVNAAIAPPPMDFEDVCTDGTGSDSRVTPGAAIVVTVPPTAVPATPLPTATSAPTPTLQPTATPPPTPVPTNPPAAAPVVATVTAAPPETAQEAAASSPTAVLVAEGAGSTTTGVQEAAAAPAIEATAVLRVRATEAPAGPPAAQPPLQATAAPTATAVAPLRAEPERAKIAAARDPVETMQLTVVGAGAALPAVQVVPPPAPEPAGQATLSYLVFLILTGSLAAYLLYARLRVHEE